MVDVRMTSREKVELCEDARALPQLQARGLGVETWKHAHAHCTMITTIYSGLVVLV